jgi:hypothetical protein
MIARTLVLIALLMTIGIAPVSTAAAQDTGAGAAAGDFASRVDLATLGRIAVHGEGRLKSFGSHANAMMDVVSGPRKIGWPSVVERHTTPRGWSVPGVG